MESNKSLAQQVVVVILAAGKGTRMGRGDLGKVCFEIDGVPAINRVITVFKRQRFRRFLLVVGAMAQQVLETVGREHPEAMFVFQYPQLGTGHAAKVAAEALANVEHTGPILLTMGDKLLEEDAITALVNGFVKQQADMALLTIPKTKATESAGGTVFLDEAGQALDIIEAPDLARAAVADELRALRAKSKTPTARRIVQIVERHLPDPKKQASAVGELLYLARRDGPVDAAGLDKLLASERYHLTVAGRRWSASEIKRTCRGFNPSLYLFNAEAFYQGVGLIDNRNAQGEYYVTDVVRCLAGIRDPEGAPRFRVRTVPVDNPLWVQGFNSPDELLAIQDYVRRKKTGQKKSNLADVVSPKLQPNQYATVKQWLAKVEAFRPSLRRWLAGIYGRHESLHERKRADLAAVLACYGRRFGLDQRVCIVRAPGRINLMGRHVDHRGGHTNFLAIDRETLAVAGLADDDRVAAVSTEPRKFKPVEFNIAELIGRFAWSDWLNFVNSQWVRSLLYGTAGDWGNYVKAAMLRLQHRFQDVRVRGINLAFSGNVPIAAGLSSSSTLVVATLQAAIALNNFQLASRQFIDLCGEGEWFVGSRGGAGDHAAIYLGQRGKIAHVGYLPFRVDRIIDAPADYQVVIANSHVRAAKSSTAKHTFNARIAAYNLGLALLRQRCPEIAHVVQYVRDLDPAKIGCTTSDLYRMFLKLPPRVTRAEFRSMLSAEHRELIESSFATHDEPDAYDPRGVLLFGASEIARSRLAVDLLAQGEVRRFGELMRVSHDGDRVARPDADGRYRAIDSGCTDAYLNQLVADLGSEDPDRVRAAQLYMQPGAYACSTPEIDEMVDVASRVPGVVGAQIAGAGLGGCIMVLVRKEKVPAVCRALAREYYRPRGLKPATLPCIATDGAGLAEF
ncbi:MAG: NTP transferase domain-containing protein [Pirellulales bacterium]|nr:NTP transferase domain-containing protein [Pirellulales bacterium]